jgi:PAS domain S-box-containing protein
MAAINIPYWLLIMLTAIIILAVLCIFIWLNKINKEIKDILQKSEDLNKTIEREKLKFKHQLDLIFDSIKDGLLIVDENGVILHANTTIIKWFNLPESITGKSISNLLNGFLSDIFTKLLHSENKDAETDIEFKSLINRNLHIGRSIIRHENGGIYGILFIVRDQTRLTTLEKTRKNLSQMSAMNYEHRLP